MDVTTLVVEAKAGDVEAFTELVRRHQSMVFGTAVACLGDIHTAEDMSQQAFVTAWRNISRLRDAERFGGWLRGIVRFECSHHVRKRRPREAPLESAATVADGMPGPPEQVERRASLERVLEAIASLPLGEREATMLFYVADLSQRDVAAILDVPVATVNNRLRSARHRLRQGAFVTMTDHDRNDIIPSHDFAERIGQIIGATGPVVDIETTAGQRPAVLDTVAIAGRERGAPVRALITHQGQHGVDHGVVIARSPDDGATVRQGMGVHKALGDEAIPLDHQAIATLIDLLRAETQSADIRETGIKAIDVCAPIPVGGVIGIAGDMQSGKMVLVEELIHRLPAGGVPISVLVFVEAGSEAAVIRQVEYRASPSVSAIYLPVEDASVDALAELLGELDAVVAISSALAAAQRYPAIDPHRSRSRLIDDRVVSTRHRDIAATTRATLTDGPTKSRAVVERYFIQPFFVAEAFTGTPGESVPLEVALDDLSGLIGLAG